LSIPILAGIDLHSGPILANIQDLLTPVDADDDGSCVGRQRPLMRLMLLRRRWCRPRVSRRSYAAMSIDTEATPHTRIKAPAKPEGCEVGT